MTHTRVFFEDDGHGWLETDRAELVQLGIADKISRYSYQRGGKVYLEEDCDASRLLEALRVKNPGLKFQEIIAREVRHHGESPIRYYDRYQA